jgi:hypothetical protein
MGEPEECVYSFRRDYPAGPACGGGLENLTDLTVAYDPARNPYRVPLFADGIKCTSRILLYQFQAVAPLVGTIKRVTDKGGGLFHGPTGRQNYQFDNFNTSRHDCLQIGTLGDYITIQLLD